MILFLINALMFRRTVIFALVATTGVRFRPVWRFVDIRVNHRTAGPRWVIGLLTRIRCSCKCSSNTHSISGISPMFISFSSFQRLLLLLPFLFIFYLLRCWTRVRWPLGTRFGAHQSGMIAFSLEAAAVKSAHLKAKIKQLRNENKTKRKQQQRRRNKPKCK